MEPLERLSAGLAHEINNPLGLILGYAQLMLKEVRPGEPFHEDLKLVEKHARKCKQIVEDLLSFSRPVRLNKTPVNLNDLINEVLSPVRQRFQKRGILIERRLLLEPIVLPVDKDKIKQAFMNILINAEQAIDRKDRIIITTKIHNSSGRAAVSFRDTGIGIEPGDISKIFDPFFTVRPGGTGIGLGLSVTYGIICAHGGEIRVNSTKGEGTLFTVLLPLEESLDGSPV